jgi:hypothetical protein
MKIGQMALDKNNQGILNNDGFIERHRRHTLPVDDPEHMDIDLATEMAERPFNADNYLKEVKNTFKYGFKIGDATPHPQDNTLEVVNMVPDLDEQTKHGIYSYSASKLNNDRSFEKMLKKDFSNPESLAKLNEVSKSVFGHEIQTDEDIAAAYTVSLLPTTATKENIRASIENQRNWQEEQMKKRFAQQEKMAKLNDRLIRSRTKANGEEEIIVGYPTNEVVEEYGVEEKLQTADGVQTKTIVYEDEVPVGIMRTMNPKDINKGIKSVKPKVAKQPDGSYRNYWDIEKDKNGNINLVGEEGKKIGAEDARSNVVNTVMPTKVKKEIITNRPKANSSAPKSTNKWDKYKK